MARMARVEGFDLAACKGHPVKEELQESWARPATGIAQLSLLEEPVGRTLALLLQGICSHLCLIGSNEGKRATRLKACRPDRLSKRHYPRLFLREPTIESIRKRRISQNGPLPWLVAPDRARHPVRSGDTAHNC